MYALSVYLFNNNSNNNNKNTNINSMVYYNNILPFDKNPNINGKEKRDTRAFARETKTEEQQDIEKEKIAT